MRQDQVIWCDNGWFPFQYGFCPSEKAWDQAMKLMKVKEKTGYLHNGEHARCDTFVSDKSELTILVSVAHHDQPDGPVIALIAHEAMHVLQCMLEHIGEEKASKEFEAYSLQNILQSLLKAYHDTRGFKGWDYKGEAK